MTIRDKRVVIHFIFSGKNMKKKKMYANGRPNAFPFAVY